MTYFERKGVELQEDAISVAEAVRRFNYSCRLCSERGHRTHCEECPIAAAHEVQIDVLKFLAAERLAAERRAALEAQKACAFQSMDHRPVRITIVI